MHTKLYLLLLVLLGSSPSFANTPTSDDRGEHQVYVAAGWDHTWLVDGGYIRTLRLRPDVLHVRFEFAGAVPVFTGPGAAWRLGHAVALEMRTPFAVGADVRLGATVSSSDDVTGAKKAFGSVVHLQPGLFFKHAAVGLDAEVRTAWLTRVVLSDDVKATFDDRHPQGTVVDEGRAVDGWYALTSHTLRLGAFVGGQLGPIGVFLRGGGELIPQTSGAVLHPMLGQLGFFAMTGVSVRWRSL